MFKFKKKKPKTEKDPTRIIWMTTELSAKLDRETYLLTTTRETLYFVVFLANLTFIAVGMIYPSMFFLTQILKEQFTETTFKSIYSDITFNQIRSAADFWRYMETNFVQSMYWDYWYDELSRIREAEPHDKSILFENKLLAVPGIRQVKVKNDSCTIHPEFRQSYLVCYDGYNAPAIDKDSFGPANSPAWKYNHPKDVKSATHVGKVGTYDGGGFYQILGHTANETIATLDMLKKNLWITRGTRSVFLDFAVYNANVNLFCVAQLVFEFPPTGGVLPTAYFFTVKLLRYVSIVDHIILGCECIHLGFTIYYTAEELREMVFMKWGYLKMFWTYIDNLIIWISYAYYVLSVIKHMKVRNVLSDVHKKSTQYISFYSVAYMELEVRNLMAIVLFLSYMKVFKYLSFNKTMGQLSNTLTKCAKDVAGFSVMFLLIFVSFAELGYLVFGTQVKEFSSFRVAMFTLLRTILGDFDYTEIEKAHRILAPLFFLLFIFLVFFVLLNMFLAIINDTYTDVKTELSIAPDQMQMAEFWKRGYYNFLLKFGCGKCVKPLTITKNEYNMTSEEIRGALKNCGFTDLDIDMFFARYNIDPEAVVGDHDISKLIQDLMGKPPEIPKGPEEKTEDNNPLVAMDDFIAQQERLDEIERVTGEIVDRLDNLLEKLNTLENVRKT